MAAVKPGDRVRLLRGGRLGRKGTVVERNGCGTRGCKNDERGGCIEVVWDDAKGAEVWGLFHAADDLELLTP